ncbi:MAG: hypothetical protein OXR72_13785, partial [Gemmatimonadota bacterium]|nr:hypothetical protein [Gemmatimonadota bacterium]
MNEKNERISKSIQDNPWICVIWIIAIIINTMLIYCLNTKSKCFCPPISSNLDAFADKDKWLLIFTIVASMLALSIGLISALRLPRQISFRLQLIVALLVTLFITMYSREKLVMETTLENFTDNRNAVEVLGDTIKARVGSVGSLVTIEADTLRDSIRIARDSIIASVDS